MDSKISMMQNSYVSSQQEFEMHQMIYGLGKYAESNPQFAADDNPTTQFQLNQAAEHAPAPDINSDPLTDLFGS